MTRVSTVRFLYKSIELALPARCIRILPGVILTKNLAKIAALKKQLFSPERGPACDRPAGFIANDALGQRIGVLSRPRIPRIRCD